MTPIETPGVADRALRYGAAVATVTWNAEVAAAYDATSADMFAAEVLDPTVDALRDLAGDGPVLEFAIGTGRVALPLRRRGLDVHGIELSEPMIDQLRRKPGGTSVPITVGDMTSARAAGPFSLVYLVFNTIMNVTTQDEQVDVFGNAAAHLAPGGRFVVEVVVPAIGRLPSTEGRRVFRADPDHVGIETFDDPVGQVAWSHHWMVSDGRLVHHAAPYRYVWPAELDLMGRVAGFSLEHRWAGWRRELFDATSDRHVSVYRLR